MIVVFLSIRAGGRLAAFWCHLSLPKYFSKNTARSHHKTHNRFPGFSVEEMPDLAGQTALVTGASLGGIGYHTALELARANATVVLAGRSQKKLEAARGSILAAVSSAKVESIILDTSSLASVKAGAELFKAKHTRCHMLVTLATRLSHI